MAAFPALEHFHWPGVLNLVTKGADLPDDDVKKMLDANPGWELASHTVHHLDLTTLDSSQLHEEVASSRKILQDRFGVPVNNFCYPSGRYDDTVIAAVKAAGYRGATSEVPGLATSAHPYVLNRIEITLDDGLNGFVSKLKAAQAGTPDRSVSPAGEHRLALGGEGRRALARGRAPRRGRRVQHQDRRGQRAALRHASTSGASPATPAVRENRHRLAAALEIDPRGVLIGRQVHEALVQPPRPSRPSRARSPTPRRASRRPTATRPTGPGSRPSSSSPTASRSRWRGLEAWR